VVLPFDDEDLVGATVADVLADPARFEGTTLADPLEGVEYGTGKAKIMLQANGAPWIHSFAHGRTVYKLKLDYRAAETLLNRATPGEVSDLFMRCAIEGDLGEDEVGRLRNLTSTITGVGKRSLDAKLKSARQEDARLQWEEQRNRRLAERRDPRPQIPRPELDAEWLPQMQVCNDVLARSAALEPPARNVDKLVAQVRAQRVPSLHFLTNHDANDVE
jgi:hypothetical protein